MFEREPPLNVPYEFLNIGGKKMSTSKGRGAAAHTIAEVIPPEQLRFLFLRHRPNHAIEFDPEGTDQIPRLFDEFDKFAAATAGREVKGELPPGYEATFRYSLLDPDADVAAEAAAFRPAFGHLALLIQIPGVDVVERVEAEKGSALTERERAILDERAGAARGVARDLRARVREAGRPARRGPAEAAELDHGPARVPRPPRRAPPSGTRRRAAMPGRHRSSLSPLRTSVPGRRAFEAIYRAFLGRTNGPRAGWLLASLDPVFVRERAREASGWTDAGGPPGPLPVGG